MGRPISRAMQQLVAMEVGKSEFIGATSISSLSNMLYRAARRSGNVYEFIGSITTYTEGKADTKHSAYLIKCMPKTGGEGVKSMKAMKKKAMPKGKPAMKKDGKKSPSKGKC